MRKKILCMILVMCMAITLMPISQVSYAEANDAASPASCEEAPSAALNAVVKTSAYAATAQTGDSSPKLVLSDAAAAAGEEVVITVSTENNPGVMALTLELVYDNTKLELVGYENVGLTGWKVNTSAVWIGSDDSVYNGVILKLKFKILDTATTGITSVGLICEEGDACNYNEETVNFQVVSGDVNIHVHEYDSVTTAPTCTSQGYTTHTCWCGASYKGEYVDACGHNYYRGYCNDCGAKDPDYVPPVEAGVIVISNERAKAGNEVTVSVSIEENPGIMAMTLELDYDKSKLELIGHEDGIMTGWKVKTSAVWVGGEDVTENGVILKLKFKVLDDVEDGDINVSILYAEGDVANSNEEIIIPGCINGVITVYTDIPGDINGDGVISALDLLRLQKYISGENVETAASCDVTGDGEINALDLTRLQRYIAGEDVVLL